METPRKRGRPAKTIKTEVEELDSFVGTKSVVLSSTSPTRTPPPPSPRSPRSPARGSPSTGEQSSTAIVNATLHLSNRIDNFRQQMEDELFEISAEVQRLHRSSVIVSEETKLKKWDDSHFKLTGVGKLFYPRPSLLTQMFLANKEFATIYNIFISVLIVWILNLTVLNYVNTGRIIDLGLLIWGFRDLPLVAMIWLPMLAYTFMGYSFKFLWGRVPLILSVPIYILYLLVLFIMPGLACFYFTMAIPCRCIIMCETARFCMKVHAFARVSYIHQKQHPHEDELQAVKLGSSTVKTYLYFLFAPTLLYRSSYPMSSRINWKRVVGYGAEFLACVFYIYVLFDFFCVPQYRASGSESTTLLQLVLSWFNSMLPGILVYLLGFYCFLHSWLNMWAELTCFEDREFYSDWWNATDWAVYYRRWNGVVHDWIYVFVYRDTVNLLSPYLSWQWAKIIAGLFVIEASALVHEYIIAVALGFMFPVLFILFGGPGVIFIYITSIGGSFQIKNVFMWTMLLLGTGMLMLLYSREYYLRDGIMAADLWDFFTPRSAVPHELLNMARLFVS